MENNVKEVAFYKYCGACKHSGQPHYEEPCNECLDFPARYSTEKPLKYEENAK